MPVANPVLAALARARADAAPMFARWCELKGARFCPARPVDVASFVSDCASLGVERVWQAMQEISGLHVSCGLADPTLGAPVAPVVSDLAGIDPPRSWSNEHKRRFKLLPYDMQLVVASHDVRRERALRRAQNDAAAARRQPDDRKPAPPKAVEENHADETNQCSNA